MYYQKDALHKLPGIVISLLVFFSIQTSFTTPITKSIDNLLMTNPDKGTLRVTLDANGGINPVQAEYVENPSRLFIDLPDTILKFNNGRTKRIQVDAGDLNGLAISQYRTNPDIVRIVLYFKGGNETALRNAVTTNVDGNNLIISYSKTNRFPQTPKIKSPDKKTADINRIEKILFKNVEDMVDRFVFESPGNFDDPDVKITENGAILNFHNTLFKIPSGYGDDFSIPVSSKIIDEVEVNNRKTGSVVFLRFDKSAKSNAFNYKMDSQKDNQLTFELACSTDLSESRPDINSMASTPIPRENELINLFQSTFGTTTQLTTSETRDGCSISKIQYVPLSLGERFIFTATGDFDPVIQSISYPDRLSIRAMNTSVVLPKEADDKYQINIDGAMSRLMKVFQRDVDGVWESSILFYYDIGENERVVYKFYQTEKENTYHLDLLPFAVAAGQKPTDKPDVALPSNIQEKASNAEIADAAKEENPSEHISVESGDEVTPVVKSSQPPTPITDYASVEAIRVVDDDSKEPLVSFNLPESEKDSSLEPVEIPLADDTSIENSISGQSKSTIPSKPEIVSPPSIRVSYVEGEDVDTFNFTCDEPIRQYRYSVLNNPCRLVLEFPNRQIDFDSTQAEHTIYVNGNATELLRISDSDGPGDWTQLHIYLKYQWDELECSLSRAFDTPVEIAGSELSFSIELKPLP